MGNRAVRIKGFNKKTILVISIIFLITAFIISVGLGSVKYSLKEIFTGLFFEKESIAYAIIHDVRIPRSIIAVLVGANLAVSGALLQSVMRNPLADPGLTGVSSGASLAAIIVMLVFPKYTYLVPICAFLGGGAACIMVFVLAWKDGIKPVRIILAGVAVNAILGGGTALLSILYSDKIQGVLLWLNGSMASKCWKDVNVLAPYTLIGLIGALLCVRCANILQLGDNTATNLGANVNGYRVIISIIAVYLAGISVSIVGLIGFIGLIVPHICRILIGSDYKFLLPFSMILGGSILVLADTLARTVASPIELPVGVIMAIIGGPFFLYLLRKGGA